MKQTRLWHLLAALSDALPDDRVLIPDPDMKTAGVFAWCSTVRLDTLPIPENLDNLTYAYVADRLGVGGQVGSRFRVEGRRDFMAGKGIMHNPHKPGTFESEEWVKGWTEENRINPSLHGSLFGLDASSGEQAPAIASGDTKAPGPSATAPLEGPDPYNLGEFMSPQLINEMRDPDRLAAPNAFAKGFWDYRAKPQQKNPYPENTPGWRQYEKGRAYAEEIADRQNTAETMARIANLFNVPESVIVENVSVYERPNHWAITLDILKTYEALEWLSFRPVPPRKRHPFDL